MYLHTLSNNQTAVTQFLTKPTSPLGEIPSQTGAEQRNFSYFWSKAPAIHKIAVEEEGIFFLQKIGVLLA